MKTSRREFLTSISMLAATTAVPLSAFSFGKTDKLKMVLVGTGARGTLFWGARLIQQYGDILEFVGLCDSNPSRMEYVKKERLQVSCNTYPDYEFEKMIHETKPDLVIVTTDDANHHKYIIKGLDMGCDVLTEKPMTIDEVKCQGILDAERRSGRNLVVGFNYRWTPYVTKVKEMLMNKAVGEIRSVDYHYYLDTHHGGNYFRRWHGLRQKSGTLLVHKSTHHFDLLNWWIDSDPAEVFGYGDLEFYGSNGPFKSDKCRTCPHTGECDFYWDISTSNFRTTMYVNHEHVDGYYRDACVYRDEINIYDKMSAQVKYANNVVLNYSLTTYGPFEGWRVAINGTEGRIEAWLDIPHLSDLSVDPADMHDIQMDQNFEEEGKAEPIIMHKLWNEYKRVNVIQTRGGHGGGDQRLQDKIFRTPGEKDPYDRAAGVRDGAMSLLIGVAARKSIESGEPIRISELTDLEPRVKRI
ncbi:MAG: Gfo/Idh/MocA family oxidoreductase [Bacteroidota bacterium]